MDGTARHSAANGSSEPFADLLKRFRRAAGLTQEQLAGAAGVSARTVSDLERGLRRTPQDGSGELLAGALGLSGADRERFFAAIRGQRLPHRAPLIGRIPVPDGAGPILGRAADLIEIERRLGAGARVVTLAGAGGIGKTTIAREVARRRQDAGGVVIWTPLEAVEHPSRVLEAVVRAAGLADRPGASLPRRIADAVARRPVLLVLDNLEHLVGAAPEIAEVLALAPTLSVIATSRETIRIAGEDVLPVNPLPLPRAFDAATLAANPAVALFLRSAGTCDPDAGDLAAAGRIVTLMDGLPLAIELAAAQTAVIPADGLAVLLERSGIEGLSLGRRDGPARFASMEAALAWSEGALTGDARRLLRLLGVFRDGFSLDAVAGVAATAGMPGLERSLLPLVSAQLVRPVDGVPGRFRMLEPIRMFAADRLRAAGEEEAAVAAHARWMFGWARRQGQALYGPEPLPALDAVERDLANIRAALSVPAADVEPALEVVCRLHTFWEYRGYQLEVVAILEAVIAAAEGTQAVASEWYLWDLFWLARFSQAIGQFGKARAWIERFERLAATSHYPGAAAFAIGLRWSDSLHHEAPGDDDERRLRDALAAMGHADPEAESWGIAALLGRALLARGDAGDAVLMLRHAVDLVRRMGAAINRPALLGMLGLALVSHGELPEAAAIVNASLETCVALGLVMPALPALTGRLELALADASADADALAGTATLFGAVEALMERSSLVHDPFWIARIAASRARLAAAFDREALRVLADEGRDLTLREAIALARSLPAPAASPAGG